MPGAYRLGCSWGCCTCPPTTVLYNRVVCPFDGRGKGPWGSHVPPWGHRAKRSLRTLGCAPGTLSPSHTLGPLGDVSLWLLHLLRPGGRTSTRPEDGQVILEPGLSWQETAAVAKVWSPRAGAVGGAPLYPLLFSPPTAPGRGTEAQPVKSPERARQGWGPHT